MHAVEVSPAIERVLRRASRTLGAVAASLGVTVLVGWALENEVLKALHPGFVAMKVNTAVAFTLLGTALVIRPSRPRAARVLASAVAAVGLSTLAELALHLDLGIDNLLVAEPAGAVHTVWPGRMALQTAVVFAILGAGTALLERFPRAAQALAVGAAAIAGLAVIGYASRAPSLYRLDEKLTPIALPTAIGAFGAAVSVFLARPDVAFAAAFARRGPAGTLARRMLPVVVLLPPALALAAHLVARGDLVPGDHEAAVVAVLTIVGFGYTLILVARRLGDTDAERQEAAAEVARSEARYRVLFDDLSSLNDELVRANADLTKRGAELTTANSELEAFAYSVAHDLRAPLRAVVGFSQAVIEDCEERLDATGRDYLHRAIAAGRTMERLIDDLLGLARVSRAEMARDVVDLSALASEICEGLRQAEPRRTVEVRIAPGLRAWGDPPLLRIALENVLRNAWKFTSRHSTASIAFGRTDGRVPEAFFVRDDGAGFDMKHADKLLRPFHRLHATGEFPGTGIGLATVARIVRRHGGDVWLHAEVEKGATVFFTLPEAPGDAHEHLETDPSRRGQSGRRGAREAGIPEKSHLE